MDAAEQVFRILRDKGMLLSGMWLFGNVPARIDQVPQPEVPYGWLLYLTLPNIHANPSTAEPAEALDSAVHLAMDFAASAPMS